MTSWTRNQESREPAVAGMFYPAQPRRIEQTLSEWLTSSSPSRETWGAALVPHAGWVYSGHIAAQVLSRIEMPATIVVLCPKHHAGGAECAVAPWSRWQFPGGSVEVDVALSKQLADEVPGLQLDDLPHRQEHAIEVQLPLLARLAPKSRIVGITIGRVGFHQCQTVAAGIASLLKDRLSEILWVISSDMNHFATDAENRRLDELALETLDQLDPEALYAVCHRHGISMCGLLPAVIVLSVLGQLGALHESRRVAYTTSAAISGDRQRVVGYAGMLFR